MSKTLLTSEVLDLAADEIRANGWTIGGGWPSDIPGVHIGPELCLEGAIFAALGMKYNTVEDENVLTSCPAYEAVTEYLDFNHRLYFWNDQKAEGGEHVIEVLRAAAAVERVKEAVAHKGYETEDQPLPLDEKAVA